MNKDDTYILPTFKEEIGKWIKKTLRHPERWNFEEKEMLPYYYQFWLRID